MFPEYLTDNFCVYNSAFLNNKHEGFNLDYGIYSLYPANSFNGIYVFMVGSIFNINDIKNEFQIKEKKTKEIVAQLYLLVRDKIAYYLDGIYSIVIIEQGKLLIFRDRLSVENLYYFINNLNNSFIISNSIFELKKFMKLEVNKKVLPKYFICSAIDVGDSFFKDVYTPSEFQLLTFDIKNHMLQFSQYDNFAYQPLSSQNLNEAEIIENIDTLFRKRVNHICKTYKGFQCINSLSGGVDSSYIQVVLNDLGYNVAYTGSYDSYFGIGGNKYAIDVANFLKLTQNTVCLRPSEIIRNIHKCIEQCEVPYIYEDEFLLSKMREEIYKTELKDYDGILIFDGNGSDTIFGFGRGLLEINYLSIHWISFLFSLFNNMLLKFVSPKNYQRYNTIIKGINSNNIDSEFLFKFFKTKEKSELIKKAFKISDVSYIYNHELEECKKYNVPFIEKLYRLKLFTYELIRENNVTFHESKSNNLLPIFPYLDLNVVKYLINIPMNKKQKFLEQKHLIKKFWQHICLKRWYIEKKSGITEIIKIFILQMKVLH